MSLAEALISTNPKDAQAHYAKMEPLGTRLRAAREEDIKAKQEKSRANWAKVDADRVKRKTGMKTLNKMMERREVERKVEDKKRIAKRKADQERSVAESKAYEKKRMAEQETDRK
jgi:hypothetical protein